MCVPCSTYEVVRMGCSLAHTHPCACLLTLLSQAPQMSQTITVGSSFACSTPRSAASSSSTSWMPSRVTKAGGLGRGSNPLDSFFPFDPYLLRRSHVYVDTIYNTWKVQFVGRLSLLPLQLLLPQKISYTASKRLAPETCMHWCARFFRVYIVILLS